MIHANELSASPSLSQWFAADAVRSGLAFSQMRQEWNELLEDSDASLFNAWEWLYPWYRRIGEDRDLRIVTVRDREGRLCGLMPLSIEHLRVRGRRLRRLCFLGDSHVGSDYLDAICRRGTEREVRAVIASYLRDTEGGWDVLDLYDLDSESPMLEVLQTAFGTGYVKRVTDRFICPGESFGEAESFDAFLKRTARRDNYLRRRKWLEKQEGYAIERADSPESLPQAMSEFFRLHTARWAEDGGSQGIKGPSVEAFHRDTTHLLAEKGVLRMYTMRVAGEAVASVYGMIHRGTFIYYQSGLDPAWRPKSVGLVLVGETFRDSCELELRHYDFLRGTESYKADWTTRQRKTVALRIYKDGGRGRVLTESEEWNAKARGLAKKLLPGGVVEKIRRLRRKRAAI